MEPRPRERQPFRRILAWRHGQRASGKSALVRRPTVSPPVWSTLVSHRTCNCTEYFRRGSQERSFHTSYPSWQSLPCRIWTQPLRARLILQPPQASYCQDPEDDRDATPKQEAQLASKGRAITGRWTESNRETHHQGNAATSFPGGNQDIVQLGGQRRQVPRSPVCTRKEPQSKVFEQSSQARPTVAHKCRPNSKS